MRVCDPPNSPISPSINTGLKEAALEEVTILSSWNPPGSRPPPPSIEMMIESLPSIRRLNGVDATKPNDLTLRGNRLLPGVDGVPVDTVDIVGIVGIVDIADIADIVVDIAVARGVRGDDKKGLLLLAIDDFIDRDCPRLLAM